MMDLEYIKKVMTTILAIIGAATVLIVFINSVADFIPKIKEWKQSLFKHVGNKFNYRKCKKIAIKNDIEATVNETVHILEKELPANWFSRAKIEWVEKEKAENMKEDELILRIRPLENQDDNLVKGVHVFIKKIVFPQIKDVIPESMRDATTLYLSRRTIEYKNSFLARKYEEDFIEKAVQENPNIATYLGKYRTIDDRGFFIGTFLRESFEIATRARFSELRNNMEEELNEILEHIIDFASKISNYKEDTMWSREGPATSYGFLLVAHPRHGGHNAYLKRAKERSAEKIERLYVMGASGEMEFFKKVISVISKQTSYKLTEIFNLNRDYRGDKGGIGALLITGVLSRDEEEKVETFFDDKQERSARGLEEKKQEQTATEEIKTK